MTIKLRFTSKWPHNFGSLLMAILGGSKQFSHVMLIDEDDCYESTILHGVRKVPVLEAMEGVKYFQDMEIPELDYEKSIEWAKSQIGKKYDYFGALGIPLLMSDDWCNDDRWWCSEYVFMILGAGGKWLLDKNEMKRVTPNDLHQCNFVKSPLYIRLNVLASKNVPSIRQLLKENFDRLDKNI